MNYKSIIPVMSSVDQSGFLMTTTASSNNNHLLRIFDDNPDTAFRSGTTPKLPEYITIHFPKPYTVGKYSLWMGHVYGADLDIMQSWEIEGLDTLSDSWEGLHAGSSLNEKCTLTFTFPPRNIKAIRIKCLSKYGNNTWGLNLFQIFEIQYDSKLLIHSGGNYLTYRSDIHNWKVVSQTEPTEQDYLQNGMDESLVIPEAAWTTLKGNIEICYYTENLHKTEAAFCIETNPFTLAEEFDDSTLQVIEYTEYMDQEESRITLETSEAFTLYDEVGDSFEVLYYTDDPTSNEAKLSISHNYSPLDLIEGDVELVTWTTEKEEIVKDEIKPDLVASTNNGEYFSSSIDLSSKLINVDVE